MKTTAQLLAVLTIVIVSLLAPYHWAFAQNPRYINLGSNAVGALYTPDSGNYSNIGIIVGHPTSNSLQCGPACRFHGRCRV